MTRIISVFVLLLAAQVAFSQKTLDRVVLKDSKVVSGRIIEKIDSVSVKIETDKNTVVVLPWSEISLINPNQVVNTAWERQHKRNLKLARVLAKGFAAEVCMPGYQYLNGSMMTAYFAAGYQMNPYIALMGGFGVETFSGTYLPLYADLRVNLLPRQLTPFLFLRGGYSLIFAKTQATSANGYKTTEFDGGMPYVNAGAGLKFKFFKHFGINIKAGYRFGYSKYTYTTERYYSGFQWNTRVIKEFKPSYLHGANVSLGIEF